MKEIFESRLPKSVRKHNRKAKSEARKGGNPNLIAKVENEISISNSQILEEKAWNNFQAVLKQKEGYSEGFQPQAQQAIREFFHLRSRLDVKESDRIKAIGEFQSKYPDELIDSLAPIFKEITDISKKTLFKKS